MLKKSYKCVILSDFNHENISRLLMNHTGLPSLEILDVPFGQIFQSLIDEESRMITMEPDIAIVWSRPESVIKMFNNVLNFRDVEIKDLLNEVDEYASLICRLKNKVKYVFVPTWVIPSYNRGLGMMDMRSGIGIENTLMRMNLRLSESLEEESNIFILNTRRWIELTGKKAFNSKLWYLGKVPFSNEVFCHAIEDIKSAIRGVYGEAKKLIILDLDDTLWGGIVGDIGWENIRLGGHDHIGEAFIDFQSALKSFLNRGILLGIVSKNEESVALEAIAKHPEMVLGLEDFVGWRINWNDKAQNIADLISELNLGPQSVVFIDDSQVERARVQEALPEVYVPDWPVEKMHYTSTLLSLDCFDKPSKSIEDSQRTRMYKKEKKRQDLLINVKSLNEWLVNLKIKVDIEELNDINIQRVSQLLNKTNQMNLRTRRLSEKELLSWSHQDNCEVWTFRVSDKFGDSGLTGITSLRFENNASIIEDFILSCRVFGRKIENVMVNTIIKKSREKNMKIIKATYLPTKKNKPCFDFWLSSGFEYIEAQNLFKWNVINEYPLPNQIEIRGI